MLPFECCLGYQPPLIPSQEEEVGVPSAQAFVWQCKRTWRVIWPTWMKQLADRRRIPAPTYWVGQRVWLSTKYIPIRGGHKSWLCGAIHNTQGQQPHRGTPKTTTGDEASISYIPCFSTKTCGSLAECNNLLQTILTNDCMWLISCTTTQTLQNNSPSRYLWHCKHANL